MVPKLLIIVLCLAMLVGASLLAEGAAKMKVMLYSSMKDSQLSALKEGFMAKHPDIEMDYYTAGTGNVMTKLAAEQQAGGIRADLIWVGEPTNYLTFKEQGLLLAYKSPEAKTISSVFKDKDDYFTAARVVILGFVYNTQNVKASDIPKDWDDLLKPRYRNYLAMTDPTFSGTSLYTVAALVQNPRFGWEYLRKLKANGIKLTKGSSDVVDKVAAGEYDVSIGVDYIAKTAMQLGSPVGFVYPKSGISVVASPIAIVKNTKNLKAAKTLYDYILSKEGQGLPMGVNLVPVRPELKLEGGITIGEIVAKALPVDDLELMAKKDEILRQFDKIMKTQ